MLELDDSGRFPVGEFEFSPHYPRESHMVFIDTKRSITAMRPNVKRRRQLTHLSEIGKEFLRWVDRVVEIELGKAQGFEHALMIIQSLRESEPS